MDPRGPARHHERTRRLGRGRPGEDVPRYADEDQVRRLRLRLPERSAPALRARERRGGGVDRGGLAERSEGAFRRSLRAHVDPHRGRRGAVRRADRAALRAPRRHVGPRRVPRHARRRTGRRFPRSRGRRRRGNGLPLLGRAHEGSPHTRESLGNVLRALPARDARARVAAEALRGGRRGHRRSERRHGREREEREARAEEARCDLPGVHDGRDGLPLAVRG